MAKGKGSGVNKSALVREALDALGMGAKPVEIDAYIKEKHNVEVSKAIISSYKSSYKSKSGKVGRGKPGRKPGGGAGGIQIEDLATVRGLVSRLGAAQVKELVDVLG
jgi:hypothetical protein